MGRDLIVVLTDVGWAYLPPYRSSAFKTKRKKQSPIATAFIEGRLLPHPAFNPMVGFP